MELAFRGAVDHEGTAVAERHAQLGREERVDPLPADVRVDVRRVVRSATAAGGGTERNDLPFPLRVQVVEDGVEAVGFLFRDKVRVVPQPERHGGCACGEGEDELLPRVGVPVPPPEPQGLVEDLRVDEQLRDGVECVRRDQSRVHRRRTAVHRVHQVLPRSLLGQYPIHMLAAAPGGDDCFDAELLLEDGSDRAEVASGRATERQDHLTFGLRGRDQRGPLGLE